jgi:hypothetical protein
MSMLVTQSTATGEKSWLKRFQNLAVNAPKAAKEVGYESEPVENNLPRLHRLCVNGDWLT